MRLTVGHLPPAVYWRRRAVVLVGLLLVLFLISRACSGPPGEPSGTAASPTGSPPPSTSPTLLTPRTSPPPPVPGNGDGGSPGETGRAGDAAGDTDGDGNDIQAGGRQQPVDERTCTDDEIQVTAGAESDTFERGEYATFSIGIRNVSDRTCTRDVGADLQELYLVEDAGTDKVWSSDDCGAARGTDVHQFTPGSERSYAVVWNGRSSTACADDPEAPDGPLPEHGGYQLIGRLGTAYSEPLTITLT